MTTENKNLHRTMFQHYTSDDIYTVVRMIVRTDVRDIDRLHPKFRDNPIFWIQLFNYLVAERETEYGYCLITAFELAPPEMKDNQHVVLEAIKYRSFLIDDASDRLKSDIDFLKIAIKTNYMIIKVIPEEVVASLIDQLPELLENQDFLEFYRKKL